MRARTGRCIFELDGALDTARYIDCRDDWALALRGIPRWKRYFPLSFRLLLAS